jgi:multiple sugar transport system ATP-binding protein
MAKVVLENFYKYFGSLCAVRDLSLEIADGEFVVLLGPSGCGKTTTLRAIAGLESVDKGNIYIDEQLVNDLKPADRDIAFMFQLYALYPHMTASENIGYPLKTQGIPKTQIDKEVRKMAQVLQIDHILAKKPNALSGGDMQRIALGRAMIRNPKALLLDEPLGTLDAKLREEMRSELKRLQVESGVTTIFVTHDQVEALSMGDRIVVMDKGELKQAGTPREVFNKPANLFVANFLGSPGMNLLGCRYDAEKKTLVIGKNDFAVGFPDHLKGFVNQSASSDEMVMGVRPGDVHVDNSPKEKWIEAEVYVFEHLGSENIISIKKGDSLLLSRTNSSFVCKPGDRVWMELDPTRIHLFDKTTGKVYR